MGYAPRAHHRGQNDRGSDRDRPAERLRLYGQSDRVRRYGPDYVDRLREAGFEVAITQVSDLIQQDEAVRMGLATTSAQIHRCRRAQAEETLPLKSPF